MRVIDLVVKDLRQFSRERMTFVFLLILPLVFTLLFGFAFGGNETAHPRLPVAVLDEDVSDLSQRLVAMLDASAVVRITARDVAVPDLEQQVADEALAAAVIIPASFGDQMRAGTPLPVTLIAIGQARYTVEGEVETDAFRLASAVQAAQFSTETAGQQGLLEDETARRAYFDEALDRAMAAWDTPPIRLATSASGALADEATEADTHYSAYAQASPGMMAQFAIAGLIGAAGILVLEKKNRCLQRLLTTNMTRAHILLGHYLAMFVLILMQLVTLILFGQLALHLPYLQQPVATLLVTVMTALFCASLGLLIGALAKTEEQVTIYALIPMFLLAGLGGAWVPLEMTPEAFQRVAYLTPLAWVMDGYKDILVRGLGLEAVRTAVAVLLAYAAGLFALAVWRFRFNQG